MQQLSKSAGIENASIEYEYFQNVVPKSFVGTSSINVGPSGPIQNINKLVWREFEPKSLVRQAGVRPVDVSQINSRNALKKTTYSGVCVQ